MCFLSYFFKTTTYKSYEIPITLVGGKSYIFWMYYKIWKIFGLRKVTLYRAYLYCLDSKEQPYSEKGLDQKTNKFLVVIELRVSWSTGSEHVDLD